MPPRDPHLRLAQLRQWRTRPEADRSLAFLRADFKRNVAKPHHQVAAIIELWRQSVPPELQAHARLDSLVHGVLKVAVDDSAHLYELDRLLRTGLQQLIVRTAKSPAVRRILLRLDQNPGPRARPGTTARQTLNPEPDVDEMA